MILCVIFCTALFAVSINAHGDGAPCAAHDSMHPSRSFHGEDSNEGKPAPYEVLLIESSSDAPVTCYGIGTKYRVRIQPKSSSDSFKGFIIQARDSSDKAVGKFILGDDDRYQCKDKKDSVTHVNSDDKSKVDAIWSTDTDVGTLIFKASVVQKLTNYYVQIPSKPVTSCK